jgi:putative ABC transport system ATP-binding protein
MAAADVASSFARGERRPPRPPPQLGGALIDLAGVSKDYDTGGTVVRAMREVNLSIAQGEFVAIVGASGSGKSTMMNILGCLDRPTRGSYTLAGIDVGGRAADSRAIVRNRVIGFIFQGFNLLPRTTALENVELPLQYRGVGARERRRRARAALDAVGLAARVDHTPNQLSGGQQQRVAIARALVTDPPLLLADEPTGNLDTRTSLEVLALLQRLNRDRAITIVLVTHEHDIAACASRVVTMRDGVIVSDVRQEAPLDAAGALASLPSPDDGPLVAGAGPLGRLGPSMHGGPVPTSVYAMMALGELVGIQAALAYIAFVLRLDAWRYFGAAILAGEVTKAIAGARWARRKLGAPPTTDQRIRMAFGYTLVVTGGAVAVATLVGGLLSSRKVPVHRLLDGVAGLVDRGGIPYAVVVVAATSFAIFCGAVLLRYLLLTLCSARR